MSPVPASGFRIWRNRPYLFFLGAVILTNVAALAVGLRTTSFYRDLDARGRVGTASVTGHEVRPALRGRDNHYYDYAYRDAAGNLHASRTAMRALVVGETIPVTYLPDAPGRHVLDEMSPQRVGQPIRDAAKFAAGSLGTTLLFGAVVHGLLTRRET